MIGMMCNFLKREDKEKPREARACAGVIAQGKLGGEKGGTGGQKKARDQSRVMTLIMFPNTLPDKE